MSNDKPTPIAKFIQWSFEGNRPALLIFGLIVVAATSLLVVNNFPKQELCSLFDGYRPTFAEQNRILTALGSTELTGYEIESGQIRVPKNLKGKYLAAIAEKDAMPEDLIKKPDFQPNLFVPRSQLKLQQLELKKKKISEMIKGLPFVADAHFEFDRQESRELFQPQQQSAVAMVTPTNNSSLNLQQLQSIQRTVASAIAGIEPHEVAIIDTFTGIAYDDIRQLDQANLIELMNWKTKRQEYYQRLLFTELNPKFPGIEIDVQVQASVREANRRGAQQSNKKIFHLAAQQNLPETAPKVGLNTTTTVTVGELPSQSSDTEVRNATYEAILPHATREIGGKNGSGTFEEKLAIKIKVPNSLMQSATHDADPAPATKRFQQLSERISTLVMTAVPKEALSDTLPIQVIPMEPIVNQDAAKTELIEIIAIQKYWPLWAVLIAGLFTVFAFRGSNQNHDSPSPNIGTSNQDVETELDLESQLTELIDHDPATAAKVLKNWIQQEH